PSRQRCCGPARRSRARPCTASRPNESRCPSAWDIGHAVLVRLAGSRAVAHTSSADVRRAAKGNAMAFKMTVPLVVQQASMECWYASACMVAYYRRPGPRLGLPDKWIANQGVALADFSRLAS